MNTKRLDWDAQAWIDEAQRIIYTMPDDSVRLPIAAAMLRAARGFDRERDAAMAIQWARAALYQVSE